MAMNFFEHQETARKKTGRLVVFFILGVTALIVSTYFIGLIIALALGESKIGADPRMHAGLLVVSALVSLVIVGIGWSVKRAQLSAGGRSVAESLGGQLIEPGTMEPSERRVLNIVEEMAIASGVPVPPVYLIPDASINAFAAGYRAEEAVIGVTRGALAAFTRDELQGVIAHEYSHILNGDMRLNIRLVAAIFGLAALAIVGRVLVQVLARSGRGVRVSSSRSGGKGGGGAVLLALMVAGVGLMIIGFVGQFFGRLMQAAVSRQREFLADASAVQFTRNPAGIANALRRIAAMGPNGMERDGAAEFSHMFFTSALASFFATHPPLAERIGRIERREADEVAAELLSGRFAASPLAPSAPDAGKARLATLQSHDDGAALSRGTASTTAQVGASPGAREPVGASPVLGAFAAPTRARAEIRHAARSMGTIEPRSIDYARSVRARIPAGVLAAAHEPFDARAVIVALLLSTDEAIAASQLDGVRENGLPEVVELALRVAEPVRALPRDLRLPLVDLCIPALRRLSPAQAASMLDAVRALIAADRKVDLFEWSLRAVLRRAFTVDGAEGAGTMRLALALPAMAQLLGTLAWSGARDEDHAATAFMAGYIAAGVPAPRIPLRSECTLDALDEAVKKLGRLRPQDRDRVVAAAVECVTSDEVVTVTESEVLRAVVAALGAPMPPAIPAAGAEQRHGDAGSFRV